jgi:hypothetical protein
MKTLALSLCLALGAFPALAQTLTKMWSYTGSDCVTPCTDNYMSMWPLVSDGTNNLFGVITDYGMSQGSQSSITQIIFDYNISSNTVTSTYDFAYNNGPPVNYQAVTSNLLYINGKVYYSDGGIGSGLYSWTPGAVKTVAVTDQNGYAMNGFGIVALPATNGDMVIYGTYTAGGANNTGYVVGYDTVTGKWTQYASSPAGIGLNGFNFSASVAGTQYLYGMGRSGSLLNAIYRWQVGGTTASSITDPVFSIGGVTGNILSSLPYLAYSSTSNAIITAGQLNSSSTGGYVTSIGLTGSPLNFNKKEGTAPSSGYMGGFSMGLNNMAFVAWPQGGANNTGAIGAFNPATNTYSTVVSFPAGTFAQPFAPPTVGADGNLWGLTTPCTGQPGGLPAVVCVGQPSIYKITGAPTH